MNNHVAKNEFNQNYQSIVRHWKQIAVNQHLENQTVSNKLPVVPGKSSYKDATDRNISIFSDIIPKGIRWKAFNSYVKFGKTKLFGFPGASLKQLSSYIYVDLENSKSDTIIIRVGINNLLNGSNEIQIDSLVQNIVAVIEKCRFYGKKFNFISGLVYTTTGKLSIKKKLAEVFCCNNRVILIDKINITGRNFVQGRFTCLRI